jgi:hypothetical protein
MGGARFPAIAAEGAGQRFREQLGGKPAGCNQDRPGQDQAGHYRQAPGEDAAALRNRRASNELDLGGGLLGLGLEISSTSFRLLLALGGGGFRLMLALGGRHFRLLVGLGGRRFGGWPLTAR